MPAWNQIVENNIRNVLNAAYRVLGNLSDAEDISQEVFSEAFDKWDADSDQNWGGLLRRLAVCRAIDLLRKRKAESGLPDEVHCSVSDWTMSSGRSFAGQIGTGVRMGDSPERVKSEFGLPDRKPNPIFGETSDSLIYQTPSGCTTKFTFVDGKLSFVATNAFFSVVSKKRNLSSDNR